MRRYLSESVGAAAEASTRPRGGSAQCIQLMSDCSALRVLVQADLIGPS